MGNMLAHLFAPSSLIFGRGRFALSSWLRLESQEEAIWNEKTGAGLGQTPPPVRAIAASAKKPAGSCAVASFV